MLRRFGLVAMLGIVALCVSPVRADDPGQKEFFKAIDLRLGAKNLFQLGQVIVHCQKAIDAGLSEGNKTFCQKMMSATLLERVRQVVGGRKLNEERKKLVLEDLEQVVKVDPTASDAMLLLAKVHAADDPKAAIAALTKAIDVEKGMGDRADADTAVQALLMRARLTEDPKQKAADFAEALKFNPENTDVLRTRGEMMLTDGKFKEAAADFQAALKIEPKNAELHSLAGLAWLAQNKLDEALKSFNTAIEIAPQPSAYLQRARIYLRQNKPQDGLNDLNKVISLVGASGQLLILRASAFHALKNDERAIKDAESALKLEPDDTELMLQAGLVLYQAKKNARAIEIFNKVVDKDAKNPAGYAGRADAYLQIGDHAKAVEDYGQAVKLEPDNTHVLNNLAWVLCTSPLKEVRNGARAVELAKKACELTEYKEAHIVSTLAAGYAESGDFAMAIKWSKKAVELGEGDVVDQLKKELASYEAKKPWREKFGEEKE